MKQYRVRILEHYYEDNFQDGEVVGTYTIDEKSNQTFSNLKEAVAWAKKWARDFVSTDPDNGYGDIIGDGILSLGGRTVALDNDANDFREPTDKEIADWKAGSINLYADDFQAVITIEDEVDNDDLAAAVAAVEAGK